MEVDLGFVYELATNMNTTRDERLEIVSSDGFPPTDTIVNKASTILMISRMGISRMEKLST